LFRHNLTAVHTVDETLVGPDAKITVKVQGFIPGGKGEHRVAESDVARRQQLRQEVYWNSAREVRLCDLDLE